jgi:hypothetical protein
VFGDKRDDTLTSQGELSVAEVLRSRRQQRLAEEAAAANAITVQAEPVAQIEAAPESEEEQEG